MRRWTAMDYVMGALIVVLALATVGWVLAAIRLREGSSDCARRCAPSGGVYNERTLRCYCAHYMREPAR